MKYFQKLSKQQKILLGLKVFIFTLLSFWLFFFLAEKINLTNSDIGRHIQNGKIILTDNASRHALLHSNFYSYTESEFPFINHHWLSGIIFFVIYKIIGFTGLSLSYLFLFWATFALAFYITQKHIGFIATSLLSIFFAPLLADRTEIRPEAFSYFFSILYFFLFLQFRQNKISFKKLLIIILPIQLLWINLHIGFAYGLMIIAGFFIDFILRDFLIKNWQKTKQVLILAFFISITSLINPAGIKGLFYPLQIFKNFGYRLAENQSIPFLEKFGMINPNFFILKLSTFLLITSFIWIIFLILKKEHILSSLFTKVGPRGISCDSKNYHERDKTKNLSSKKNVLQKNFPPLRKERAREGLILLIKHPLVANFIISSFFCIMAWTASRNLSHFGIFALLSLGINIGIIKKSLRLKMPKIDYSLMLLGAFCLAGFMLIVNAKTLPSHISKFGIGIKKNNLESIDFFKKNQLPGPIFNNYDIGSFLIFGLYPKNKVFTDNRPEAYPEKHFQEIYIPMQEDENIFRQQDELYNFETIFFYQHDYTNWGQKFLIEKIADKNWIPVFVDDDVIVFIKNNNKNKAIIEKFRLPDEMFQVTK